nr:hypothetical protein [uncultured Sellimonas sp.]
MKRNLWYLGYIISLLIITIILITDFPTWTDIALSILFACIFSVSHTNLLHEKMLQEDRDYRIEVSDERNIAIKERAGNVTNMITLILVGFATVLLIALDYIVPAVITGSIVVIHPVILIFVSHIIAKKM